MKNFCKLFFALITLTITCFSVGAATTNKSVMIDANNDTLRSTNFFRTNLLSGAGTSFAFDSQGRLTITATGAGQPASANLTNWSGVGTNQVVFVTDFQTYTNGIGAAYQPADAQLTNLAGLSYGGNASKYIRVNAGETGFELATVSGGGATFEPTQFGTDGTYTNIAAGATVSNFVIRASSLSQGLSLDSGVANAQLMFEKGGTNRWQNILTGNETGSNAGSVYELNAYDDSGNFIDYVYRVGRPASSNFLFYRAVTIRTNDLLVGGSVNITSNITNSAMSPTNALVYVDTNGVLKSVGTISGGTFANGTLTITAGTGDVTGPASSTDNGLVLMDGLTGKIIKNSDVTLTGLDLAGLGSVTSSNAYFNTAITVDGGITNASLTPLKVVYADANSRLVSASYGPSDTVLSITNAGNSSYSLINNSNAPVPALKSLSISGGTLTDEGTNVLITVTGGSSSGPILVGYKLVSITNTYANTATMAIGNTNFIDTQGLAIITNSYSPVSTTNTLEFFVGTYHSASALNSMAGAVFETGNSTARTASLLGTVHAADYVLPVAWSSYAAPLSEGSTVDFVFRAGRTGGAATWTINRRNSATETLGGDSKIVFWIKEWKDLTP